VSELEIYFYLLPFVSYLNSLIDQIASQPLCIDQIAFQSLIDQIVVRDSVVDQIVGAFFYTANSET